ncbi:sensory rhodopsin transducer [Cohnella zeiphila]|uniref:Sensory rhodopsin transducer n=1 Tax=Cohnella zeiphila TaxID=2761120 RepID=A0A7X0SJ23_9BACL|nr:sensory rhodopsin transducer [Cohnella zeiphila]MBB6730872.1 hypothetical protein [Cohnella zeiphila]
MEAEVFSMTGGKKTWYIADGWIPRRGIEEHANYVGHEAVIILNTQSQNARIYMDIYFEEKEPWENIEITVPAKKVRCLRMDNPADIGNQCLQRHEQYALRLRSDVPVIVQFGRMDTTQSNLAYIGVMGYGE